MTIMLSLSAESRKSHGSMAVNWGKVFKSMIVLRKSDSSAKIWLGENFDV